MSAGDRYPSERREFVAAETGTTIVQLTAAPCINHAPYFLNQAWALTHGTGQRHPCVIITSYRDAGQPNLFAVDEASGELWQLTDTGDVNPWSACVSHVLRPKMNIPVQVMAENPMTSHASCDGMDRPSQISSSQANTMNNAIPGQTPTLSGQLTFGLRGARGFDRIRSHQSNIAAHGLTTDQTLPTKADR